MEDIKYNIQCPNYDTIYAPPEYDSYCLYNKNFLRNNECEKCIIGCSKCGVKINPEFFNGKDILCSECYLKYLFKVRTDLYFQMEEVKEQIANIRAREKNND